MRLFLSSAGSIWKSLEPRSRARSDLTLRRRECSEPARRAVRCGFLLLPLSCRSHRHLCAFIKQFKWYETSLSKSSPKAMSQTSNLAAVSFAAPVRTYALGSLLANPTRSGKHCTWRLPSNNKRLPSIAMAIAIVFCRLCNFTPTTTATLIKRSPSE